MLELLAPLEVFTTMALAMLCFCNLILGLSLVYSSRTMKAERKQLKAEMQAFIRKVEQLTATKREQLIQEYNRLLDSLTKRLPTTIASEASTVIFETESKILSRLAELEPNLRRDDPSFQRMDDLIRSMEELERTIISSTAQTVERVLVESRDNLLEIAEES